MAKWACSVYAVMFMKAPESTGTACPQCKAGAASKFTTQLLKVRPDMGRPSM